MTDAIGADEISLWALGSSLRAAPPATAEVAGKKLTRQRLAEGPRSSPKLLFAYRDDQEMAARMPKPESGTRVDLRQGSPRQGG
jgi:hypothetical protein